MFEMPDNDFVLPDFQLQESDNQLDAYNYVKISASYRFNLGGHHDYKYIEMDNSQKSGILREN